MGQSTEFQPSDDVGAHDASIVPKSDRGSDMGRHRGY